MIVLSGADLVLPDRLLAPGTLVIDDGRIVEIRSGLVPSGFAFESHFILPGFVDVHVHGVGGADALDEGDAIAEIAAALPRYGVTAFCPTTVACEPLALRRVLGQVRRAREAPRARAARVLPAHLESNFINPDYRGAQPETCLRQPGSASIAEASSAASAAVRGERAGASAPNDFTAADVLHELERAAPDVGIVTLAPELEGSLDLIRWLRRQGHHVSLGHSGATCDEALAGIAAGARQATHLFNRMTPVAHREPGLAGAVLQADEVAAEIICDGVHVHPAMVRVAVAAKGPSRMMAITDATAAAGLAVGSARLGGQPIRAAQGVAVLADGTWAGSVLTMDGALRMLVGAGLSLPEAAVMCATTAARELGLQGHGVLAEGAAADLVVLDRQLQVVQTYVGGALAYARG